MIASTLLTFALLSQTPAQAPRVISLQEAEQQALAHQPALAQAAAQTEGARARVAQARAPLFPQVSANAAYGLTTGNRALGIQTGPAGGDGTTTVVQSSPGKITAAVSASQLLWDFGQTTGRLDASEHSLEAQKLSQAVTQRDVLNDVRVAFFGARAAEDQLQVANELFANQQRHEQQVEALVRVGTRPEIDLAQARADLANAKLSVVRAENGMALAQSELERSMGVRLPRPFVVSREVIPPLPFEDAPVDELVKRAVEGRDELRAFDQQVAGQQSSIAATRGAYFPRLGLTADASGNGLGTTTSDYALGASGRITLSWKLFNGFQTNADLQLAHANLNALEAQREGALQQIRYEVEQAALSLKAAQAALVASTEAEANARERLRLAEGRYAAGVGNIIELADAQLQQAQAASSRVQAEYDLSVARAQLQRAVGGS